MNNKKRYPLDHRGLAYKSRKLRGTWSNREVWPCSTKQSGTKVNRVLPREHTSQSKHHLPTTQETTLYMENTTWSLPKWDWLYSFQLKMEKLYIAVSVQSLYHVRRLEIPWTAAHQVSLSFTNSQSLLKLMFIESMMPSNHLILCLSLLLLPSMILIPSIRVFSNELALPTRWAKYRSFSFIISPSNEYLELISFQIDLFDLLAVQGTLKSLLQHHNSKASVLQHSAFFMVHAWLLEKP